MAEYMFKAELERKGLAEKYEVQSAGTLGFDGMPAAAESVAVLAERGIDGSAHRSQALTETLIRRSRLVIGMTVAHAAAAEHMAPDAADRCRVITEFTDGDPSRGVADPIGMSIEVYRQCADEISAAFPAIIAFLNRSEHGRE
ncbi:MAG: low molecular weight protein arginine phosphatase [Candidatus Hydrogenedentes bacterium]|nr:low molecular weight protein arginine phosphatase [Candidatus Hydrogenedentota bacterium]